ncbi:MAG TPA: GNAT family N-acetyltransferase [Caulobacteraceae bacterium]|jgi:RimJ/RimL family protein N-acetyltransferase|nr:GNAT family N-acetyltransferase [Caulobacteraceae bacterium]
MTSTHEDTVIETPRLLMRAPRIEDFDAWAQFCSDAETMRYLGGALTRPAAWRNMLTFTGAWRLQGFGYFSVIEKATGAWIGRVGPWFPEAWPGGEVGWGIARAHTGRGYAVEAATAAIDFVFDKLGWEQVIHVIDPDNQPSQAVAKRVGSGLRGPVILPPPLETWPTEIWGQSREAWRARARA